MNQPIKQGTNQPTKINQSADGPIETGPAASKSTVVGDDGGGGGQKRAV